MASEIAHVSLLVDDYDDAIAFFRDKLRFTVLEDKPVPDQSKRWVLLAPPGSTGASLLLSRAVGQMQRKSIGNQAGGRVFLFLTTDDFWRDYDSMRSAGIEFVREPTREDYGTVAVFLDLYGNRWDLIERVRDE